MVGLTPWPVKTGPVVIMMDADVYALFLLGLLGTGHCLGMCSPLVLAFPARTGSFEAHLLYHLGRVMTYTAVGALVGGMGAGLTGMAARGDGAGLETVTRVQILFSGAAALFMFLFGLARIGLMPEPKWMSTAAPSKLPWFRKARDAASGRKSVPANFFLGLMLGLLPCGLSYAAFARALPAGSALKGGLMVLAFGLGTVPGLLLLGTAASRIFQRYRRLSDILSGLLMIGMAASLAADAVSRM
jgi:sulfite exporter TauE/SafE